MNSIMNQYDYEIIKEALGNLLKRQDYHQAPPTIKNNMLMRECCRLYNEE